MSIKYESDLNYKKRVIDVKSNSFCGAKWYNATIWLGSGMTTSCHHPLPHKIDTDLVKSNPKLLHNTSQKKSERRQMQSGIRPSGCEYCWKIEDMNTDSVSDRVYKTKIYSDKDLAEAFNTDSNHDFNLQTLEIAFDRTCQFACSYCNPAFSTTWVNDIRRNGPYQNLISDGRNHFTHAHDSSQLFKFGEYNPYVDAFFKWWESDLHLSLKELRITGGEPLMSADTWRLLDWFKNNKGKSKTRLALNSNLGSDVDINRLLTAIDGLEFDLYTSNESVGFQAEYIRDGLDWEVWLSNITTLIESNKLRGLHVMCTVNALCLDSLPQFLDLLVKMKIRYGRDYPNFTLNILRFPSFQSALILPENIKMKYREQLINFLIKHKGNNYLHEHEINHVQRLIDYLDVVKTPHSEAFDMPKLLNDFKQFYLQYDQRRNKNFTKTFPALSNWFDSL